MKKATFLILFAILATLGAHAQYYIIDTLQLNSAYRALMAAPNDPAKQMAFFDAFPASWSEYATTYIQPVASGKNRAIHQPFDDRMTAIALDQVLSFGKLNTIPDSLICPKAVNIAVSAVYDVDGPNYFLSTLRNLMKDRESEMLKVISEMTVGDQLRFWMFFWASQFEHPQAKANFERLYNVMLKKYPADAPAMKIGFEYANGKSVFDADGHIGMKTRTGQCL